jgi:protein tyrosine/serine phosphatase
VNRKLDWPACINARDLGGLAAGPRRTRHGALVRSDSLTRLTAQGIAALKAYGIGTVIDLRYPGEWIESPNPLAGDPEVRLAPISLLGVEGAQVHARDGQILDRVDWMQMVLRLSADNVAAIMCAIAAAPDGGVLFHCAGGKDRTGVVAMLLLSLAGVAEVEIAADYALSAEGVREAQSQMQAKYAANPMALRRIDYNFGCSPEVMLRSLDHLQVAYGGAEAYLRGIGLHDVEVRRIRERLV